jgi:hypothetical protein
LKKRLEPLPLLFFRSVFGENLRRSVIAAEPQVRLEISHLHVASIGSAAVQRFPRQQAPTKDLANKPILKISESRAAFIVIAEPEIPQAELSSFGFEIFENRRNAPPSLVGIPRQLCFEYLVRRNALGHVSITSSSAASTCILLLQTF